MAPRSRFRSLIKRTELVTLALCAAVGISLYLSGPVLAQEYDPWQSYLDTNVAGINITVTPGACGTGTIVLQWPTISQADGYRLARDGSDVIYEGAAPTYTDTGLSAGSSHKYYFNAYKGYTTANTAKMVNATAPGNCVPVAPSAPTNLSASYNQTAAGVVLNWSAGTSYTGTNIMRRTGGGSFAQISSLTGTQTTYTDTANLTPGTAYEYQVVACSSAGCSGPSNSASATTPAAATQTTTATTTATTTSPGTQTSTAPSSATGLSAQYYSPAGGIALSWTNPSAAATSMSLERRVLSGTFAAIRSITASQTTYVDTSITTATAYEYRIVSCNGTGNCVNSNIATAATPAPSTTTATTSTTNATVTTTNNTTTGTAPAAPVVSVTSPSGCGVFTLYLSWQVVSGASSYDVYRDNALMVHTTNTSFGDAGLPAGSQHTYRVAARNSAGVTPSAIVSGTVPSACATAATTAAQTTAGIQPTTQPTPSETPVIVPPPAPVTTRQPTAPAPAETQPSPAATAPVPAYTTVLPPVPQPTTPQQAPSVIVESMQSVVETVQNAQIAVDSAKQEIIRAIDAHIAAVLAAGSAQNRVDAEARIKEMRDALVSEIEIVIDGATTLTPAQMKRLQKIADDGLARIDDVVVIDTTVPAVTRTGVGDAISQLGDTLNKVTAALATGPTGDVFKDSNKDGISDYDSVHIYRLDPIAPSPVTVVDGKKITAGEKVLRGYDPTATELVPVVHEEPVASLAPETTVYKVETVSLTETKEVRITGTALPNSYVTLYIYSTPVVVTVKTDRNGKWEYTVDHELETGEHKIYAASVDNTGKIVAKTVAIPFTRTAEAATLDTAPPLGAASVQKPGIINNRALYPLIALSILFVVGVLYVMGKGNPKNPLPPTPPSAPTAA